MAEEEVGLRLSLKDRRETAAGLDDVRHKVDDVGDTAERAGRQASIASRGFAAMGKAGRMAGTLMKWGFAGVLAAGYGVTRLLRSSFAEAREAQKIGATTRQIIKSTGGVARVSYRHVDRYVGRLSELIGVDDELIQQSGNLLLTFKNVRNEAGKGNKVWDRALGLAGDLAATGFGSMESSAKMLGKALNDPLKGVTALSRAGVTFSEGQVERIENFIEENRLLDAQRLILGEVKSQVGGVAREQATFGDRASVMWGNLQERLGTALLPMLDRLQGWFVREGGPALDRYIGIFEERGIPKLERFAGVIRDDVLPVARDVAETVLPAAADALGAVWRIAKKAAPKAKELVDAFAGMPQWAQSLLVGGGAAAAIGSKLGLNRLLAGGAKGIVSKASPVPVIVMNPGALGGGLPGAGGPGGVAAGGKGGIWSKLLKWGGAPAAAFGAGYELNKNFPDLMPFGDEGWLSGMSLAPKEGGGWLSWFQDEDKVTAAADRAEHLWDNWQSGSVEFRRSLKGTELEVDGFFGLFTAGTDDTQRRLDRLGDTDVKPTFGTPGLPEANRNTNTLANLLGIVGRGANAHVDVDTSSASSKLDAIQQRLSSFASSSYSAFVGVFGGGAEPRALGGPVSTGRPYVVGERRPELFVPKTNGYILPKVPDPIDVAKAMGGDDTEVIVGPGSYGETTVVQVVLPDGRVLAETVLDHLGDAAVNR